LALVPGSTAGPYRIVEPLGRGGMASVYKAYEAALDRYVALKVLPREFLHDPGFAARFEREAKAIARLEHPNIVPIYAYDIDKQEGIPWMAMRLIGLNSGGALSSLIRGTRLPFARSVAILRGVAEALDYAHAKDVVHRDIKPQNVLLDDDGRVYLADFGIAKMLDASGGLTATGMITGTPQYMAPEQATGKSVGPAADVYALGIVAYEMFTGSKPFDADTPIAVMMKHVQEPLPIPPASTLPESLLRPLLKCTAKTPEDRWPSAGVFVTALEAGLAPKTVAVADVPTLPAKPPSPLATTPVHAAVSPPTAPVPAPTVAATPAAVPPRRPPVPAAVPPAAVPRPAPAGAAAPGVSRVPAAMLGLAVLGFVGLLVVAVAGWLWLRPPSPPAPEAASRPIEPTAEPGRGEGLPTPPPSATAAASPAAPETMTAPAPRPTLPSATATPFRSPGRPGADAARETSSRESPAASVAAAPAPTPVATPVPTPAVNPEIAQLASALSQGDAGSRWRAAQALGSYRAEAATAVPALTSALSDRTAEVRWRSAEALGLIGAPSAPAVAALAQALSDADPLVRTEATKALGLLGAASAQASPQLARGLASPDVSIRRESARALGRVGVGAAPAVAALVGALSDKDKFVRMESAKALGRIGPSAREATTALSTAARDPDLLVSREAQTALRAIGN
jgi:hypothetical protein